MARGGTALYVLPEDGRAEELAELMRVEQVAANEALVDDYVLLANLDFQHPLFAPFARPRFNDFTKIHFWRYRRIQLADDSPARAVASFDSGDPAVIELPVAQGALFVLTTSWRPRDSQLARSSKFVPLLSAMLDRGRGAQHSPYYQVNEPIPLETTADAAGPWTVQKPDGSQAQLAAGATSFEDTDQPGIYQLSAANVQRRVAVNMAASESRTAPLELDQLEQYGVRIGSQEARTAVAELQQEEQKADLESKQMLWRWLASLAVVVLIGETWLAGRAARTQQIVAETG